MSFLLSKRIISYSYYINLNLLLAPTKKWVITPLETLSGKELNREGMIRPPTGIHETCDFQYPDKKNNEVKYGKSSLLKTNDKFKVIPRGEQYECHDF